MADESHLPHFLGHFIQLGLSRAISPISSPLNRIYLFFPGVSAACRVLLTIRRLRVHQDDGQLNTNITGRRSNSFSEPTQCCTMLALAPHCAGTEHCEQLPPYLEVRSPRMLWPWREGKEVSKGTGEGCQSFALKSNALKSVKGSSDGNKGDDTDPNCPPQSSEMGREKGARSVSSFSLHPSSCHQPSGTRPHSTTQEGIPAACAHRAHPPRDTTRLTFTL